MAMVDYVLEMTFSLYRQDLDELVRGKLFLSSSTGDYTLEREGQATIAAFFDHEADRATLLEQISSLSEIALRAVDRERVDWLDRYEQSLVAIPIGDRFIVAPKAELIDAGERIGIVIPQERAFGTGSHASTALCIEALESMDLETRQCVDVGSGSGILAIVMARLLARRVIALDNELDTLGVIRANLHRNGVSSQQVLHFIGGPDSLRGQHDVVVMNIIPEVIVPLLPEVVALMHEDSRLILSGILFDRKDDVLAAAGRRGLTLETDRSRGEWWCGQFRL